MRCLHPSKLVHFRQLCPGLRYFSIRNALLLTWKASFAMLFNIFCATVFFCSLRLFQKSRKNLPFHTPHCHSHFRRARWARHQDRWEKDGEVLETNPDDPYLRPRSSSDRFSDISSNASGILDFSPAPDEKIIIPGLATKSLEPSPSQPLSISYHHHQHHPHCSHVIPPQIMYQKEWKLPPQFLKWLPEIYNSVGPIVIMKIMTSDH